MQQVSVALNLTAQHQRHERPFRVMPDGHARDQDARRAFEGGPGQCRRAQPGRVAGKPARGANAPVYQRADVQELRDLHSLGAANSRSGASICAISPHCMTATRSAMVKASD